MRAFVANRTREQLNPPLPICVHRKAPSHHTNVVNTLGFSIILVLAPHSDCDAHVQQRRQESLDVAQILECKAAVFWDYPNRGLQYRKKLIECIQDILQSLKADSVYAPSYFELHPDHRALAWSAAEAVRRPEHCYCLEMYEVGNPLAPKRLLDISDLPQRQLEAVNCHF